MSIKIISEKIFFQKPIIFHHFVISNEMFSLKNYRQVHKSRFYVCVGKIWRKKMFLKIFCTILSHGEKTCLLFVKTFPTGLWKPHCIFRTYFFENFNGSFYSFETLINFLPAFWHFSRRGCQNCILRVLGKYLMKKNLENLNFFTTLSFWTKILRVFFEFSLPDLSELHSTCPWETWMKTFFAQSIYILLYWDIERIFLPLAWKSSSGVLETAFFVSKTTFWGKLFFLKEILLLSSFLLNEQKLFDNLAFFGKVVKTLYWLPVRKIWGDFFPENTGFPIIFGNWVKLYWLLLISSARFSAGSSKFHTTC